MIVLKKFPNQVELTQKLIDSGFKNIEVIDILDGLAVIHISETCQISKIVKKKKKNVFCYKSLDLIRRLQDKGADINCILTESAKEFVNTTSYLKVFGEENIFKPFHTFT